MNIGFVLSADETKGTFHSSNKGDYSLPCSQTNELNLGASINRKNFCRYLFYYELGKFVLKNIKDLRNSNLFALFLVYKL